MTYTNLSSGKSKKLKIKNKIEKLLAIDFGCGQNKTDAEQLFQHALITEEQKQNIKITGIDISKCNGVDKVHDLTKFPYPFKDNSIDAIFASHFVEHLNGSDRVQFMNECYRILKLGCNMKLIHPYGWSNRAFQDPYHLSFINADSYAYFDKNWREANKLTHYPINCDFEYSISYSWMDNTWALKSQEARDFAARNYINIIADLYVMLKKR